MGHQDSAYDTGVFRWRYNEMGPKSDDACFGSCTSRTTFIDAGGNWHFSHTDALSYTQSFIPDGQYFFMKKNYCKNNSSYVYTAACSTCTN